MPPESGLHLTVIGPGFEAAFRHAEQDLAAQRFEPADHCHSAAIIGQEIGAGAAGNLPVMAGAQWNLVLRGPAGDGGQRVGECCRFAMEREFIGQDAGDDDGQSGSPQASRS